MALQKRTPHDDLERAISILRATPARGPKTTLRGDAARAAGAVQAAHMGPLPSVTRSPARQVHLSFSYGQIPDNLSFSNGQFQGNLRT